MNSNSSGNTAGPALVGGQSVGAAGGSGGGKPAISFARLTTVLHDPRRWKILRELARGEALPVSEISRRVGGPSNSVQKNMAVLKEAKLVVQVYGRLYRLAPEFPVSAEGTRLDLGFCSLHLDRVGV